MCIIDLADQHRNICDGQSLDIHHIDDDKCELALGRDLSNILTTTLTLPINTAVVSIPCAPLKGVLPPCWHESRVGLYG